LALQVEPGSAAMGEASTPDFGVPQISGTQLIYTAAILPQDCQNTDRTWSLSFAAGVDASGNMVMGTEELDAFRIDCLAPAFDTSPHRRTLAAIADREPGTASMAMEDYGRSVLPGGAL
jgi:hypothetical protein